MLNRNARIQYDPKHSTLSRSTVALLNTDLRARELSESEFRVRLLQRARPLGKKSR